MVARVETATEVFDTVSEITIAAFNAQGLPYGPRARHSYPVKREDVFSQPIQGGDEQAPSECRSIIAYIMANHIPLFDPMRSDHRLPTDTYIASYFRRSRSRANGMIGMGCKLIAREEYRSAYHRALIECQRRNITMWNVGKAVRRGNCDQ